MNRRNIEQTLYKHISSTVLAISQRSSVTCIRPSMYVASSSLVITSHMPSQARTIKAICSSGLFEREKYVISGSGETNCWSGRRLELFLYSKSPSARETASEPFTRWMRTVPPASWIRWRSAWSPRIPQMILFCYTVWKQSILLGLWSFVARRTRPSVETSIARESPTFKKWIRSGSTKQQIAVEPLLSSTKHRHVIFIFEREWWSTWISISIFFSPFMIEFEIGIFNCHF